MKKLIVLFLLSGKIGYSQVYVNGVDLNKETKSFELHMAQKPFTSKDCYYVDYGQSDFKEHFYDHKSQAIYDKDSIRFEKGQYMKLLNYLESQGWIKDSQRDSKLGTVKISIILFRKKEESKN